MIAEKVSLLLFRLLPSVFSTLQSSAVSELSAPPLLEEDSWFELLTLESFDGETNLC